MPRHRTLLPLAALAATLALPVHAAAPPRSVSFRDDIYPLLRARCLRCHQGSNPASGVRLDARAELLGESNGRPLAAPGDVRRSRLLHVVRGDDPERRMPPPGRGKQLTPAEVGLLRAWVEQGLAWDERVLPPPGPPAHWAFRPVRRPAVPAADEMTRTPVDAFLAAAWKAKGLTPAAEATRRTLIRRLTFDLTGLPPSPDEVEAFERDSRPDAYERLVDRLLASPAYGERWGRHWLDVARYADSEGYESNHPRAHAWRYRDWVIDSFNRDRPWAEFVRLQIAGDAVRPYADDNLVATGFLAAARLSSNEEDRARQRNDILVDVVNTTASAFLGLTFACAQCHNHKFDPITARDYYRFQAFFIGGQPANLKLHDPALHARYRAALPEGYLAAQQRRDDILAATRARLVAAARQALPADQRRALEVPPQRRTEQEETLARQAEYSLQFGAGQVDRAVSAAQRQELDALTKKLAAWAKTVPDVPQTFGFYGPATAARLVEVLPMRGFYPLPYDAAFLGRLRAHLLVGGDVHRRGPAVLPGWPAVLGPTPPTPSPRLALADWLTGRDNPLVARVWVNRLWQWHFGRGIVATAADFGTRGAAPSHPELLDWLAEEFRASGGSTKHVHRLIVLSRGYRLSSAHHAGNAAIDADNEYRWRWSPRRLEAEAIRDGLLAVAGDLDARAGGPGDADERTSRRRGLYLFQKRDQPPMLQGLFDGPSASAESCPKRGTSTVPLHALFLLNNRFPRDRAESLARRVLERAGSGRDAQIAEVFRQVLARKPAAAELEASRRFFARHGEPGALTTFCQALVNLNEFVYLE